MTQLDAVLGLVDEVVGPDLIGAYLHGSAVLGGLRPASDVDVLAVARRSLDAVRRRDLLSGLLEVSGLTRQMRPVELIVVVQSEVRPWRYPPIADFLYGEWLRSDYTSGMVPRRETMPDLAVLISMVLAGNHTLAGPPPAEVFDPVPHSDLVRACTAGLPALVEELETDTRNVVLTLARIWTTVATGEVRPKDTAADWALARLPAAHRPVLAHARRLYLESHYCEETWSPDLRARLRPHVAHILAEIDRLSPG
jgi:predicted nucleotidyltransferase